MADACSKLSCRIEGCPDFSLPPFNLNQPHVGQLVFIVPSLVPVDEACRQINDGRLFTTVGDFHVVSDGRASKLLCIEISSSKSNSEWKTRLRQVVEKHLGESWEMVCVESSGERASICLLNASDPSHECAAPTTVNNELANGNPHEDTITIWLSPVNRRIVAGSCKSPVPKLMMNGESKPDGTATAATGKIMVKKRVLRKVATPKKSSPPVEGESPSTAEATTPELSAVKGTDDPPVNGCSKLECDKPTGVAEAVREERKSVDQGQSSATNSPSVTKKNRSGGLVGKIAAMFNGNGTGKTQVPDSLPSDPQPPVVISAHSASPEENSITKKNSIFEIAKGHNAEQPKHEVNGIGKGSDTSAVALENGHAEKATSSPYSTGEYTSSKDASSSYRTIAVDSYVPEVKPVIGAGEVASSEIAKERAGAYRQPATENGTSHSEITVTKPSVTLEKVLDKEGTDDSPDKSDRSKMDVTSAESAVSDEYSSAVSSLSSSSSSSSRTGRRTAEKILQERRTLSVPPATSSLLSVHLNSSSLPGQHHRLLSSSYVNGRPLGQQLSPISSGSSLPDDEATSNLNDEDERTLCMSSEHAGGRKEEEDDLKSDALDLTSCREDFSLASSLVSETFATRNFGGGTSTAITKTTKNSLGTSAAGTSKPDYQQASTLPSPWSLRVSPPKEQRREMMRGMTDVPVVVLQQVLSMFSYQDLAELRRVHPHWDELCGQFLNSA